MKFKLSYLTLIFAIGACEVLAQSQYRFHRYSKKDGLASDLVWSMEKDSLGYIWIQYQGALTRFDGYNFKIFRYNAIDSARSALDFLLGRLICDFDGNIWIPNHKAPVDKPKVLIKYDTKTDAFIKHIVDVGDVNVNEYLFESRDVVWLGTGKLGLFLHDFTTGETQRFYIPNQDKEIESRQNAIVGMKDLGETILLSTYRGLWVFNKKTKLFVRPNSAPTDTTILFQSITRILPNQHGTAHTWVSSNEIMLKLDSTCSVVMKYTLPEGVQIRPFKSAIDEDGVIWAGGVFDSKTGLYRFDPRDSSLINLKHDPADPWSLASDIVYDVMIDKDQNIWVGTDNGVSLLRKKSLRFYNTGLHDGTIYASCVYRSGASDYLIINKLNTESGNRNQLMMAKIDPNKPGSISFKPIFDPILGGFTQAVNQGNKLLWVSNWPTGRILGYSLVPETKNRQAAIVELFHNPSNKNTIRSNEVGKIWENSAGHLLVSAGGAIDMVMNNVAYGTEGSVVHFNLARPGDVSAYPRDDQTAWALDFNGDTLSIYHKDSIEFVGRFRELLSTLQHSADGSVLLGGQDVIYRLSGKNRPYLFRKVADLPNTEVNAIQEDSSGRIWIYGDSKLVCYNPQNKFTTEFAEEEDIQHIKSFAIDWLHKTSSGLMITTGPNGVTVFDPNTFKIDRRQVNLVLTGLSVNNTAITGQYLPGDVDFSVASHISLLEEIKLDYLHNNFSLEFSAMQMTAPEKNLYKHMLEGFDPDWIETDYRNRTATYTNLPSGTYTFRVKASNHHGVWSDNERTLKVIILPPPWRTWWAYTGYSMLVAGLLVWARRNIVQRERLKSNLALEKVEREKEHYELEKAKEVDKVKTSFFTNISHEFRTPLTLIKGPVDTMLERYKDDPEAVQRLKLVQRNSDLLLRLINQLLDLAKLESGTMKVEKSSGDVYGLVKAITNSFTSFASHKQVEVKAEVPEGRQQVMMDKDKVETILINLINNAIKFTPAGGTVTVTAKMQNTGNQVPSGADSKFKIQDSKFTTLNSLLLLVSDTGIGIPSDQQQKIFERFHQVSEAHKEVGTGVGLSLVKELVALMGGTIKVDSEVGKGSEFMVTLPVELASVEEGMMNSEFRISNDELNNNGQPQELPTHNSKLATQDSELPTILIVEDNGDLRHFIIDSLGNEFHFLEAENGKQGLDKATEQIPDLIISDVMMPEMDGMEMAEKIKRDMRTSHIPLIMLTAKSTEASKLEGLEKGADDYLTKPFNRQELLLKVRNGVSRQQKLREKLRAELLSEAPKVEVLSEDEKFLNTVKEKILERLSDEQLSVESLAEDIGLSRVQLYRKVSGLAGIAVNELIRKLRMQRAAQLLAQNWGPVSQVAYEVGFSNLSYFSKVFKEEFGVLPSEYEAKN